MKYYIIEILERKYYIFSFEKNPNKFEGYLTQLDKDSVAVLLYPDDRYDFFCGIYSRDGAPMSFNLDTELALTAFFERVRGYPKGSFEIQSKDGEAYNLQVSMKGGVSSNPMKCKLLCAKKPVFVSGCHLNCSLVDCLGRCKIFKTENADMFDISLTLPCLLPSREKTVSVTAISGEVEMLVRCLLSEGYPLSAALMSAAFSFSDYDSVKILYRSKEYFAEIKHGTVSLLVPYSSFEISEKQMQV